MALIVKNVAICKCNSDQIKTIGILLILKIKRGRSLFFPFAGHHNKRKNYFLYLRISIFNPNVTPKLTMAPSAASTDVLIRSALLILANMASSVPPNVPALVVLSK
jgi:hypothetical protein